MHSNWVLAKSRNDCWEEDLGYDNNIMTLYSAVVLRMVRFSSDELIINLFNSSTNFSN